MPPASPKPQLLCLYNSISCITFLWSLLHLHPEGCIPLTRCVVGPEDHSAGKLRLARGDVTLVGDIRAADRERGFAAGRDIARRSPIMGANETIAAPPPRPRMPRSCGGDRRGADE